MPNVARMSFVLHTAAPFTLLDLITATISGAQSLSQAVHCTIINNIRCTVPVTSCTLHNYQQYPVQVPVTSCTLHNYQQYPVHSPCHKLHTTQLSTISGAQSLSQAPHYNNLILPPPPPTPAHLSLHSLGSIGIKNQIHFIITLNAAAQLLH